MRSIKNNNKGNANGFKKGLALSLMALALTGCAGVGEVKVEDRAKSGQYDGPWRVNVNKAASIQYVQGWNMSCGDMSGAFGIMVKDGMLEMRNRNDNYKTPVAEDGRFKLVLPLGDVSSASGQSSTTMANGDTKIILRGKLKPSGGGGHITYGIAEVGYSGCTASTDFEFVGPPPSKSI